MLSVDIPILSADFIPESGPRAFGSAQQTDFLLEAFGIVPI